MNVFDTLLMMRVALNKQQNPILQGLFEALIPVPVVKVSVLDGVALVVELAVKPHVFSLIVKSTNDDSCVEVEAADDLQAPYGMVMEVMRDLKYAMERQVEVFNLIGMIETKYNNCFVAGD